MFKAHLRTLVTFVLRLGGAACGIEGSRSGSHSVRSGGESAMFWAGYDIEIIKRRGRRPSSTLQQYIGGATAACPLSAEKSLTHSICVVSRQDEPASAVDPIEDVRERAMRSQINNDAMISRTQCRKPSEIRGWAGRNGMGSCRWNSCYNTIICWGDELLNPTLTALWQCMDVTTCSVSNAAIPPAVGR